ncbi:ribosome biogenesis protein ytm1 [Malassezia equina]|uniref:Ribosome biogenesis protein ytm1 n=1 Tax=Malassezia equina TaxID=1381935 RepID=A0AAF0EAT3_9BASI|nr:ribosome biogenesis protein ytm1 [Malassezia equina]
MASQDVVQFLSSLGSPLVDGSDDVAQKKLPASAVVQLLDAQIDTLTTKTQPPPASEAVDNANTVEDFVTDELHEALESYSKATARYTHTTMVASVVSDMTRALRHVVALRQAMDGDHMEEIANTCAKAESELAKIGIEADFREGVVTLDTTAPLAPYASMDMLLNLCKSLANQCLRADETEESSDLDIITTDASICLITEQVHQPDRPTQLRGSEMKMGQLSRKLLDQVIEPMMNCALQWKITRMENGVRLERTNSLDSLKKGASIPTLKAVLSIIQPIIPENHELRASLLRHLIPPMIDLVKTHLLSSLPSVHSSEEIQAYKGLLVERAMELHRHLVQLRFVADSALPRTKMPMGAPEPLSDLPAWIKTVDAVCKQHVVGTVLDGVRSIVMDTNDQLWDPVSKQVPTSSTFRAPLQPTVDKPATVIAEKQPSSTTTPQEQPSTPKTPVSKGKKPTLGVVKIGAKFPGTHQKTEPSTVPPKKEEPEDDWGWGDEDETETNPQDTTEKDDLDDDWGWGEDDAEVEQILTETQVPSSHEQEAEPAYLEDDSMDAWDWGEDDTEAEPELAPPSQVAAALTEPPSHLWQTYSVSKRINKIHESLATQWSRLDEDVPMRQWTAQGLVESVQLYRGLMPIVHGQVLQHVPLLGILFVNDCAYTAITLREYAKQANKWGAFRLASRQTLEASLRAEADLLDDMSSQWRAALVAFQAHSLHECMDQADKFSRTDDNARYEACERAILQVQHLLSHLVAVWRPVMPMDVLLQVLCELVDGLFSRVMQEIEDLQDISEPESMRLAKLCHQLLEAATSVLEGSETQVPTYFKFAYLPDILQGSMADLEYLLFGNESGSALNDYTREEMAMIVRALFADTPNRRRLLDGIQRWNSGSHV